MSQHYDLFHKVLGHRLSKSRLWLIMFIVIVYCLGVLVSICSIRGILNKSDSCYAISTSYTDACNIFFISNGWREPLCKLCENIQIDMVL